MIQIEHLTPYQCEMLDILWDMETDVEYWEWYELLEPCDQQLADVLSFLIILESMESELIDTTLACEYLQKFQLQ
jgi:hypothetical protein